MQKIWPIIRKKIPDAELHIYGSYPPKKATQLNNSKSGFLIKGWAEDAFDMLANARVCLAPLRFGAGIKGKLIDSMQVGTPNVTTDIGAEGMAGSFSWPGIIANDVNSIATAAIELYQNEKLWQKTHDFVDKLEKYGDKINIHPHFLYADGDVHKLENYSERFYKEFERFKDYPDYFTFEDKLGNKKMYNDYNIFENEFTNFKNWDCWNNNYEISYTGVVHRVCFEERKDLLTNPFFFRDIGRVCAVSCPHTSCNCDGLLKIFKEKKQNA